MGVNVLDFPDLEEALLLAKVGARLPAHARQCRPYRVAQLTSLQTPAARPLDGGTARPAWPPSPISCPPPTAHAAQERARGEDAERLSRDRRGAATLSALRSFKAGEFRPGKVPARCASPPPLQRLRRAPPAARPRASTARYRGLRRLEPPHAPHPPACRRPLGARHAAGGEHRLPSHQGRGGGAPGDVHAVRARRGRQQRRAKRLGMGMCQWPCSLAVLHRVPQVGASLRPCAGRAIAAASLRRAQVCGMLAFR